MGSEERSVEEEPASLAGKLRFLSDPAAYPHAPPGVDVVETHMSYVFLAGDRVYKLKKPVRYPFLDFSTIAAREFNCREEARLNRRLSDDVYRGVVPLVLGTRGLSLGGEGTPVDWLVEMRRLPRENMLDRIVAAGGPNDAQLDAICEKLSAFYRMAPPSPIAAPAYLARFFQEQEINRDVLLRRNFALDHGRTPLLLDALDGRLACERRALEEQVEAGRIIDGHGDLRPEHICLTDPIVIFDCLEFNANLRQVDPFDEIALLGVECAQLGAPALARKFVEGVALRLDVAPPWRLVALYSAWRAILRARLSVAHLLDATPRDPSKWEPLASRYLDIAQQALGVVI